MQNYYKLCLLSVRLVYKIVSLFLAVCWQVAEAMDDRVGITVQADDDQLSRHHSLLSLPPLWPVGDKDIVMTPTLYI